MVANDKDRQTLANNPTGTKDAIDEMFFEERVTTVNVEILATTVTYEEDADGQKWIAHCPRNDHAATRL